MVSGSKENLQEQAPCPMCGKHCPLDECVRDSQGRAFHKKCYREALVKSASS